MAEQTAPSQASTGDRLPTVERRVAVRYPSIPGTVSSSVRAGTEVYLPATVRDMSQRGLGLIVSQPVAVGTVVGVELHSPTMQVPYFLLAHVAHVREQPDRRWLLGCRLATPLPDSLQSEPEA